MSDQWLRKVGLTVTSPSGNYDLSQMQVQFHVRSVDQTTPKNAMIRVLNLSDNTSKSIQSEFDSVLLQAGYQTGAYGDIFHGTIKQIKRGRLNPTDTYLDILAADGDANHLFGYVNTSIEAAQNTVQNRLNAVTVGLGKPTSGINTAYAPDVPLGPAQPRGRVLFNMGNEAMRSLCLAQQWSWTIENGQLVIIPFNGYRPGETVVLNSQTGMIGLPEQTEDGISVRCLLNPKLQIGSQININNKSIQTASVSMQLGVPNNLPSISSDGNYKILVIDHHGDTRGNEWYSDITCLAIDSSATPSINPFSAS